MVRLIGIVLILSGTVGIGYDRIYQMKRHFRFLLDWREYMSKIQGDIEKQRKPLLDIFTELRENAPGVFPAFSALVLKKLMQYENSSPYSCWCQAGGEWENRKMLKKEEGQLFLECGRLLEQGSDGLFEKEAEWLLERLNLLIQREQAELKNRIKVSMYLCATAGIFLVLILV